MCERPRELLDRYRGGFPGDFWNRFGMEIITADLNDYLRIYLLPSLLALLLIPPPSPRAPRERRYGFITIHADSSSAERYQSVACWFRRYSKHKMQYIDNNVFVDFKHCLIIVRLMESIRSQSDTVYHFQVCKYFWRYMLQNWIFYFRTIDCAEIWRDFSFEIFYFSTLNCSIVQYYDYERTFRRTHRYKSLVSNSRGN